MPKDNVSPFRTFKIPAHLRVNSEFIPSRLEENTASALHDLQSSGLQPEDIDAVIIGDLKVPANATAGYLIPYTTPQGEWVVDSDNELVMHARKLFYPERHDPRAPRYLNPTAEELAQHDLNSTPPYIPRIYHENTKTSTLAICEGEKKTVAVNKYLGVSAIGIGGCWNWRDKNNSNIDAWIMEVVLNHTEVVIIPDGDLMRYDICRAYGTFTQELIHTLEGKGIEVSILKPEDKIDDLIVQWGPEAEANFESIPKIHPNDLVEDSGLLAKRYHLAYKQQKDSIRVEQNHSNVVKLLEGHPAFEEIWMDTDRNQVMIGEKESVPGFTEMEICMHFQHNFHMPNVKPQQIKECLMQQALKNKRSPLLTFIQRQLWDGQDRLGSWLTRLWQVEDNEYTQEVARKWFISAVARMEDPGCKLDWMLVVTGAQGIGKSSMPDVMFNGNTVALYGNSTDKDTIMSIHGGLCIIVDEMDSMNKKDVTFWKTLITTKEDRVRPPYGAGLMVYPRRSVIYGTTNSKHFLQEDSTGYRRYAAIEVNGMFNFEGFKQELPQLWAQAYAEYRDGAEFTNIETKIDKSKYVEDDPLREKIEAFLEDWTAEPSSSQWYGELQGEYYWEFRPIDLYEIANIGSVTSPKIAKKVKEILTEYGGAKVPNRIGHNGVRVWRFKAADLDAALGRLEEE